MTKKLPENFKLAKKLLRSQKEFNSCQYFDEKALYSLDKNKIKNCSACAVGVLIQNLPEEQFDECLQEIIRSIGNHNDICSLKNTKNILCNYYNLTQEQLMSLQRINDRFSNFGSACPNEDRVNRVRKFVSELKFGAL